MNAVVHTHTPNLVVYDPRSQVACAVDYCRSHTQDLAQRRITRTRYDEAGRAVAQWDPRLYNLHMDDPTVPPNLANVYSLTGQVLSTQSVDAGLRVQLFGESGQGVYFQDGRGTQREVEFDALLRPLAVFEQGLCTERFTYAGADPIAASHNQCRQIIRHDDPAGTRHFNEYAMGGAVLDQVQHFLQALDTPDWPMPTQQRDDLLEPGDGARTLAYLNALGEVMQQTDAAGNHQGSHYSVDGQLREAWLQLKDSPTRKVLVSAITYDAHGRTERKTLGNGVISQFEYSPQDGRLMNLRSHRGSGERLQDLHYVYDPVGNIVSIEDKTLAVRFFANQRIDPISCFWYDSLYQLFEATGYEAGSAGKGPNQQADPRAVANFRQTYRYDLGGNLLELIHHGPQNHGRVLKAARYSNRCLPERDGVPPTEAEIAAAFDANGNLLALEMGRALEWDHRNQLAQVRPVQRQSALDDTERYIYGADGMRQRKVRTAQTNARAVISETRYLPGLEIRNVYGDELQVITAGAVQVLHWETAPPKRMANDQLRYTLEDHLGSCALELDADARVVSRESYHPFGSTAFWERGDSSEESYRTLGYSGKERDATGLYYYGLRYYIAWLQRWLNSDPAGPIDGLNLYRMVRNNPVTLNDPDGLSPTGDLVRKVRESKEFLQEFKENPAKALRSMEKTLLESGYPSAQVTEALARVSARLKEDVSDVTARTGAMSLGAPQKKISAERYENMKTFFDIYSTNAGAAAINTAMRNNSAISLQGAKIVSELSRRHGAEHFEGRSGRERKANLIATADTLDRNDIKHIANTLYKQVNENTSTFFRGQSITDEGLDRFLEAKGSDTVFYSPSLLSVSRSKAVAEEFMGGGQLELLFEIKGFSASTMTSSLTAKGESEHVFSPHADFRVINVGTRAANKNQYLVKLEEIRGHHGERKVMPY
ncbi:RHS repeat protein [Pseudomonas sp. P115]|nr:RHS repeat protein [Pseudomonas pisciculturae]